MRLPEFTPLADPSRRRLLGGMAAALPMTLLSGCNRSAEDATSASVSVAEDLVVAPPPGEAALTTGKLADAIKLLNEEISIDLHSHPGAFFFKNAPLPEDPVIAAMAKGAGFEERTVADMQAGGLTAAVFSTVSDAPLIGAGPQGLFAHREFNPGEAYAEHQRELQMLEDMIANGLVYPIRTEADFALAKASQLTGAILGTEGGDFLEQRVERVEEAHLAGIRVIGLVHYHVNEIGDIQTASAVHHGLTDFGRQAVIEMNRVGILADLAHATFETTRGAAEITSAPIMISHSFLVDTDIQHPRLLSEDHARLVADTGGIVGGWPSGVGNTTFESFVDRLFRLVDLLGIDHVGLGTDMDANYQPVFTNYRQLPYLPHTLIERGMNRAETEKLLGGNFLRVFAEVAAASTANG